MNVADARDALMYAQTMTAEIVMEVMGEWYRPDDEVKLAMYAAATPPEAWDYVDDDTMNGIAEVLNA